MASDDGAEGAIRRALAALQKAGVPYMLTGSFASSFHGAPRTTQDIDIVIAPTLGSLQRLVSEFPEDQYYVSREAALQAYGSESLFNVIDLESGWKIDFIVRKSRPFSVEEFARRREAEVLGTNVTIASAEDVILSKLEWAKNGWLRTSDHGRGRNSSHARRRHRRGVRGAVGCRAGSPERMGTCICRSRPN